MIKMITQKKCHVKLKNPLNYSKKQGVLTRFQSYAIIPSHNETKIKSDLQNLSFRATVSTTSMGIIFPMKFGSG